MALDMGDPYAVLNEALTPPENSAITSSLMYLDSLNAVDVQADDDNAEAGQMLSSQITPLGFHLAALPISPRIGKLILFGVLLHCIDPVLTIAAIMSSKSPFVTPFGEQAQADESKLKYIEGDSDLLTSLNAYMSWKLLTAENTNDSANALRKDSRGKSNIEYDYCRRNYLSLNNLRIIDQMRAQFMSLLKSIGFLGEDVSIETIAGSSANKYGYSIDILRCAICAALSPNILTIPLAQRPKNESSILTLPKKVCEITFQGRKQLGGGEMAIHPSSVLSNSQTLPYANLLYLDVLQTSKAYAKDVTAVSSLILVLFSSKMDSHVDNRRTNGGYVITIDDWMNFAVENTLTYRCISSLRELVQQTFLDKVLNPAMDFSTHWLNVLDMIVDIVR
jgi:ATP-dependent RNA helicase DHX57